MDRSPMIENSSFDEFTPKLNPLASFHHQTCQIGSLFLLQSEMSIKQATSGASHVVKSTTSLDFFSNATKSTTNDAFLNTVDVLKFKKPKKPSKVKPQTMRSSVQPFHPFLNATESYKLSIVARSLRPSPPLTHEAELSIGKTQISNDYKFPTQRAAWDFVQSMRTEFLELQQIKAYIPTLSVDSIDENLSNIISEKLNNGITLESLNEILSSPMTNSAFIAVTKEEKFIYIIQRYLTQENSSLLFKFIQQYVIEADNPQLALKCFQTTKHCVTRHGIRSKSSLWLPLTNLHNLIISKYPTLSENQELQISLLTAALFYKSITQSHEILTKLEQEGFCPDSETFARYLKLTLRLNSKLENSKVKDSSKDSNEHFLEQLKGLDDTIFTTINHTCAKYLLTGSRTLNEITSVLDILELRYETEELKELLPTIEPTIREALSLISTSNSSLQGRNGDAVFPQKLGILNRLAKYSPWTQETKVFIIEQAIRHGSFILARQKLDDIVITKETLEHLQAQSLQTKGNTYLYPWRAGHDPLSYREFLKAIEEKLLLV